MKVYDTVNKVELEATEKELVDIMVNGRQVDLILNEKKTDADGYLTWDVEHWSSIDIVALAAFLPQQAQQLK